MKIYVKKTLSNHLAPAYDSDYESLKKISQGQLIEVTIKQPRNIGHHRKFFALMNLLFANSDITDDFDAFRKVITMKAGYYKEIDTGKGITYLPKSISFAKMDQTEFQELYDKVVDVGVKLIGVDRQDIIDNLVDFM